MNLALALTVKEIFYLIYAAIASDTVTQVTAKKSTSFGNAL